MNKPWEALLATSAVVSIALGGVVVTSVSASAADLPVTGTTEVPVDVAAPGTAPVGAAAPAEAPSPAAPAAPAPADVPPTDVPVADAPTAEPVEPDAAPVADGAAAPDAAAPAADEEIAAAALAPAPDAPVLDGGTIGLYEVTRAQGATDTDVPLTFTGTGLAGAVVSLDFARADDVTDAVDPDVSVVVGADGRWSASVRISAGTSVYTATQHTVDADGAATSEESAPSAERRIVVIAQVLPQWGVVDQESDEKWVADIVSDDGVEYAEVFVNGTTGTLYRAEISLVSVDRSTTYEVVRPEEYADGKWAHSFAITPGQYRIAVRQISDEPGTFPRYNSGLNYSPVITVVPSSDVVASAPVVTTPGNGSTLVVPGGRDGTPVTLAGTGQPGYQVVAYAEPRDEDGTYAYFDGAGDGPLLVGADGRWSAAEQELPAGVYDVTVYQYDSSLQNPTASETTTLTFEVRAATAVTPAGTGSAVRPSAGGSLAYTGSDDATRSLVGGGLAIALGALGLVVARLRRRSATESDVTTLS
ncbi:hypothetical protein [Frigoribacterium sp. MCBA15_019]|uniref:hypothetical protein n=1 Tax=Frigoribacterium sp. MCBA15_019 TaxID=1898745 RepID=UPI0008DE71FA|nr:hypothetical protein [Frigoribacterium sp. MCBA15_019]OII22326.1 hypothetical protein BIV04_08105 [Frigoribacterium sp. MCBA15_019]